MSSETIRKGDWQVFSTSEREAMAEAGIAVFEGRLILDAQPPIDEEIIAAIARRCAGPLPDDLVALWRTAFGGRLSYDLTADFPGGPARVGFAELFFPESDGYHDLWGWIDHEERLAKEAAEEQGKRWSGALGALPFGGFEYTDRLYAVVERKPDHGAVFAWMHGLPPAWTFRLNEDSVTQVATDVRALFRSLTLEVDPTNGDEDATGTPMLEEIESLATLGAAGRSAADRLVGLVRTAVVDWRAAVEDGTVVGRPTLRRLALEHAARNDDVVLLESLARLGCDLAERLSADAGACELALASSSLRAARFLLDRGVPSVAALRYGAGMADPDLARELLRRGARVDEHAVFAAVDANHLDTALVLLEHLGQVGSLRLAIRARERASDAESTAKQLDSGAVSSNVSAGEYRQRADRLRAFADTVDPTLRRR